MKLRTRHSLSGRLIGLFLLTGLALGLVVKAGFEFVFDNSMRDLARPHVAEYVRYLLEEIGHPPSRAKAAELADRLPLEIHILGPGMDWSSSGSPPDLGKRHLRRHRLSSGQWVRAGKIKGGFVLLARQDGYRIILQHQGLEPAPWASLALILTLLGVLAILLSAYHGIRRLFRPLETIRGGLARIGSGDLDHRIQIHRKRKDELGELADSVNAMADDIQGMLEAKRQLLLAISHELRSPLTRARVNLALLPESEIRNALQRDLTEMEALTGELLESERLNARHAALNLSAEAPSELARRLIEEQFADRGIRTQWPTDSLYVALDPVRFRLLLRNLLENALRHTPEQAPPPELRIGAELGAWTLSVIDHGPGIPKEHLERITEPFYRADPSRQRATGGYGLGLYLCRAIVEAHGGTMTVVSDVGEGTEVLARFVLKD